jgi:hypothetical protein
MKSLAKLLAITAVAGATMAAHAAPVAFMVRPNNWVSAAAAALVPLDGGGAVVLNFAAPAAARYVLSYSAECAVEAPAGNSSAWVDLDVIVNGVTIAPTVGAGDAFCTSNGTPVFDAWVRPSITMVIPVVQGANNVRIQARMNNGAMRISLGDSSLVIQN